MFVAVPLDPRPRSPARYSRCWQDVSRKERSRMSNTSCQQSCGSCGPLTERPDGRDHDAPTLSRPPGASSLRNSPGTMTVSRPIRDLLAPLVLWESFPEDLVAIEALESTAAASIRF